LDPAALYSGDWAAQAEQAPANFEAIAVAPW